MTFLLISIGSAIVMFLWVAATQNTWKKKANNTNFKDYHIHHSLIGIVLFVFGFFFLSFYGTIISAIGFGIFISHGFEEIYFNHKKPTKAFFIFVTKGGKDEKI